jgi:threonine dehydrogenase-like Zn-dependent dehydrogenase
MKALCWHGKEDVRVDTVDDPVSDSCIDAVGAEAHGHGTVNALVDTAKDPAHVKGVPNPYALQQIAKCCRKGGSQRYLEPLLKLVVEGEIDLSQIITHRLALADAPQGYDLFQKHEDGCIKVVLTP